MAYTHLLTRAKNDGTIYGTFMKKQGTGKYTATTLSKTLDNPNAYPSTDDNFGFSVGISGNYAIVGARYEDDGSPTVGAWSGKAYIFDVSTGNVLHILDNPNPTGTSYGDYFGIDVDISGNYAIVGAYHEDTGWENAGSAYIYNVTTGALIHSLNIGDGFDYFGFSVAIDGSYAIVGTQSGDRAYIFDVTTGNLLHTLDNPEGVGNGNFGWSVDIKGIYAIIGNKYSSDSYQHSGKAYIYNVFTGTLIHTLVNPNAHGISEYDEFGSKVAINNKYAVVSARQESDETASAVSGKVYIFDTNNGSLLHTLNNPTPIGTGYQDRFGSGLSISSDYITATSFYESNGRTYIFHAPTGKLIHTIDQPGTGWFGRDADIEETTIIVGAPETDNDGKAYIYTLA